LTADEKSLEGNCQQLKEWLLKDDWGNPLIRAIQESLIQEIASVQTFGIKGTLLASAQLIVSDSK